MISMVEKDIYGEILLLIDVKPYSTKQHPYEVMNHPGQDQESIV